MFRRLGLILAISVCTLGGGCRSTDWGMSSYFPTFGMTSEEEADLPSPKATLQAEMPVVEGSWEGPT